MSLHLAHLHLPYGGRNTLRQQLTQLRGQLADRDQRIAELTAALDDSLDREQLHSLCAPHERLTPAAVLERYGSPRAEHPAPQAPGAHTVAGAVAGREWGWER
ncbi:hypothetical protein [Nocardia sp. CA-120079]|uniref:hypothetical protein n=1 Tax=Nocardia sp. CA-120079 TaxID=3239974 RepID=UPI003D97AED9